ncbi:hypothetical protein AQJ23_28675 [Streptomyces antibioticus]|nr:radical SAM protein [Streptomyces antibioticus]KUN22030.1 hypothetical protein AQJ23_28675 [Streptomyces antibioticus]
MTHPRRLLPDYVDFRPLGRCNLACPFCYGPRHDMPTMSEDDALRVAEILRAERVKGVVFSGGEPTLLPYLVRLAAALGAPYESGAPGPRLVLSTNGLAPVARMHQIVPHLDWLALPLESADADENATLRIGHPRQQQRVLELLKEVRRTYRAVGIKLGTVLTRQNVKGAHRVLELIQDDSSLPDTWKIYEMSPTNYGADNREALALTTEEFEEAVERCGKAAVDRGVEICVYRNSTRSGKYFFVDPDGSAVIIEDGQERRLGNFFELHSTGALSLRDAVAHEGNQHNFTSTYPTWPRTRSPFAAGEVL